MHIVVLPASPKTSQSTIRALLADPAEPTVTGVYRDARRVPDEFRQHPRFEAVQGDIADAQSLDGVFAGADAVATITPPLHAEADPIAKARELAGNVKHAVLGQGGKSSSVKRLVYVSSVGAQFEQGTGEIRTNHEAEQALLGAAPEVVFMRCAYFMENWATSLATLKADPPFFYSVICPADYKIPMVSVRDIGWICAAQLLADGSAASVDGDPYSTRDVQQAFEAATGKTVEVKLVQDDQLPGFFAQAFKEPMASLFVEMTRSFLPGGVAAKDMNQGAQIRRGKDTLNETVRRMLEE
ncbi:hypothetical protein PG993_008281 [Apiospora rasikravindrae]|uniref:NAD(P)-binding domain-containing protein n=1 Tax=Apiospora rasikravindrae TaxID=990691 RepID=A0ABR1SZW6_9PEZI